MKSSKMTNINKTDCELKNQINKRNVPFCWRGDQRGRWRARCDESEKRFRWINKCTIDGGRRLNQGRQGQLEISPSGLGSGGVMEYSGSLRCRWIWGSRGEIRFHLFDFSFIF